MEEVKPTRPPKRKQPNVSPPLSAEDKELFTEPTNKYAPRRKVGKPTLGAPNRVETIGLGNLKVITTNGRTDVQSE
jgi:hypothetical protein